MGTLCLALTMSGQTVLRKPIFRPDWTFKAPQAGNATYLYVAEHGEGNTKRDALNQALGRVFQSTANRLGQTVSTDDINHAVQSGSDFEVVAKRMKVPINKVCEFAQQNPVDDTWTVYILCQVARAGNLTPEFETCEECTKHQLFDEAMKKWEQQKADSAKNVQDIRNRRNATALVASTFVPGLGQMIKGHGGAGAGILLSELAVVGGGVTCYYFGQEQVKIMKASGTTFDEFKAAQKMKNTYDIMMYSCFGVAGVIHIVNMCNAWLISDRNLPSNYSFVPALIPTNEYSQKSYAVGAGVQIKF